MFQLRSTLDTCPITGQNSGQEWEFESIQSALEFAEQEFSVTLWSFEMGELIWENPDTSASLESLRIVW